VTKEIQKILKITERRNKKLFKFSPIMTILVSNWEKLQKQIGKKKLKIIKRTPITELTKKLNTTKTHNGIKEEKKHYPNQGH